MITCQCKERGYAQFLAITLFDIRLVLERLKCPKGHLTPLTKQNPGNSNSNSSDHS